MDIIHVTDKQLLEASMYLTISREGSKPLRVRVPTSDIAVVLWKAYRDAEEMGGSDMGEGCGDIRDIKGNLIATVAYNGRVKLPDGSFLDGMTSEQWVKHCSEVDVLDRKYVSCPQCGHGHADNVDCPTCGKCGHVSDECICDADVDDDGGRTRIGNTPTCEDCGKSFDNCSCEVDEELAAEIADTPFYCEGCGREESVCSLTPCPGVIADREEPVTEEELQALLDAAKDAQHAHWDAMFALEQAIGFDIDDCDTDLEGLTVDDIRIMFNSNTEEEAK